MKSDLNAVKIVQALKKRYPQKADMDLGNPEDSLIATILSARTTDIQVLKIFPSFRKKYPNWKKLAAADVKGIAASISSIGLYRNKAKSLKALAQKLLNDFNGSVPSTMDQMIALPGVGRKTASCVLSYSFGVPSIAVDTHVFRIARRLGWSKGKTPEKVEFDIKELLPEKLWSDVNRTMVRFGREICVGGNKPKCWMCPLAKFCPFEPKTKEK
ncbi:MAG: endonuclease III [Patescibacteria group bacterium]|nr:endonuclease III [Patescibacteria group bacterium]